MTCNVYCSVFSVWRGVGPWLSGGASTQDSVGHNMDPLGVTRVVECTIVLLDGRSIAANWKEKPMNWVFTLVI